MGLEYSLPRGEPQIALPCSQCHKQLGAPPLPPYLLGAFREKMLALFIVWAGRRQAKGNCGSSADADLSVVRSRLETGTHKV